MSGFFSRFFGKKVAAPTPAPARVFAPFPEDYSAEVKGLLRVIRKYEVDSDEEIVERVNEFYFDSIDWINNGEDVDLDSFYELIAAIMKYMRSEVSTDGGNDFRLDNELHGEGIQDNEFYLNPKNEKFLLKLIALGPEADHFLCCLLSELGGKLSRTFIDQAFDIVMKRSSLNDCEHIQDWPAKYNFNSDVEVSGNVVAEFIQRDCLSAPQVLKVIKFLSKNVDNLEEWQIHTCNFQLAQCIHTPLGYLKELASDQTLRFAWVREENGDWDFIETTIAALAQKNMETRESLS